MKKWVKKLYLLGFSPLPIGAHSKEPRIFKKGDIKNFHYERPPEKQIDSWLDQGAYENMALLMGSAHGNICCIDVDDPKALNILDMNTEIMMQEGYWITDTPGEPGRCHIFMINEGDIDFTRKTKHNIELRGNEHYVMFYPSVNGKNRIWDFQNTKDIDKLVVPKTGNAAVVWTNITDALTEHYGEEDESLNTMKKNEFYDKSPECIRLAWENGAKKGERNSIIFALSSWCNQVGIPEDVAEVTILGWFESKCEQGDMSKLKILNSIHDSYQGNETGCTYIQNNTRFCPYDEKKQCKFFHPEIKDKEALLEKYKVLKINDKGKVTGKYYNRFGELILNEHDLHVRKIKVDKYLTKAPLYYYNKGIYLPDADSEIKKIVLEYFKDASDRERKEVLSYIRDKIQPTDLSELMADPRYICVKNGILNIETNEFIDHTPEMFFLSKLPVDCKPDAKCPEIKKRLKEIIGDDPKQFKFLRNIFGYCLYRDTPFDVIIIFYGTGANGKTVIMGLIEFLVGSENICETKLHLLATNRFESGNLEGKHVALTSELSAKQIEDSEMLKDISGGKYIRAEIKGGSIYKFKNHAKLISAANKLPVIKDKTYGMSRRLNTLVFYNKFPKRAKSTIMKLHEVLAADSEEMSGLLNWSIEGLKDTLKNGHLDEPVIKCDGEVIGGMERYDELRDSHFRFVRGYIQFSNDDKLPTQNVYDIYERWAKIYDLPIVRKSVLFQAIKNRAYNLKKSQEFTKIPEEFSTTDTKKDGKRVKCRAYRHIRWYTPFEIEEKSDQKKIVESREYKEEKLMKELNEKNVEELN